MPSSTESPPASADLATGRDRAEPDASPQRAAEARFKRVVAEAARALAADCAAVYVADAGGTPARWRVDSDDLPASEARSQRRTIRIVAGEGALGSALTARRGVSLLRRVGRRQWAIAAAPLRGLTDEATGLLVLFAREPRRVTIAELEQLERFGAEAGLAHEYALLADRFQEAEGHHRFVLDRLPDVVWAAGADRVFTYISAGCRPLLGYEPEELMGQSSTVVMHESSRDAYAAGYRWQIEHPDADQTYRVNLRHKDGHAVPVELHNIGTPVDGRYGGGTGSVRDISERERLERELREQAEELAAARERGHLAQELHDSVTHTLFSMAMTAGAARMLLERGRPGVREKLDELSTLAHDALTEMRSLILELRPGRVAEEGLVPAVRRHVAEVHARTGLDVSLVVEEPLPALAAPVEDALYRIAQEALHNIVKHARARHASIVLGAADRVVELQVVDDGVGFDPESLLPGMGLESMRSRAQRFGGDFSVESHSGGGTVARVRIPRSE